ncbi:MAG: polysaccharide deacetylase family protein [Magnetococcales bacterium]|nr:polysaccharide deacetylase family protein [Magnetococcales bacterium]
MPEGHAPVLLVVVDTEEEFDWNAPFSREACAVTAMAAVGRGQAVCDRFKVSPVYVVDYAVVSREEGWAPLKEIHDSFRGVIGAHLHPWNTPPFEEELSQANAYPGNLPATLEQSKLRHLTARIQEVFGRTPCIYKAGRYGFGPHTAQLLETEGFECDLSPAPPFDFRADGGPNYLSEGNEPCWFGHRRRLLRLPTTGGFCGFWRGSGSRLYPLISQGWRKALHLPGVMARLGLLERMRLSPEGHTLEEMRRLTRTLLGDGLRVFTLSYHSPTLKPGCTPYVRDERELERFLATLEGYLAFFLGELGGVSLTPLELRDRLVGGKKNTW